MSRPHLHVGQLLQGVQAQPVRGTARRPVVERVANCQHHPQHRVQPLARHDLRAGACMRLVRCALLAGPRSERC